MTDPHLVTLNPEQRHAVEHGVRPLLINAGAGSGKTKTLAHRVAHLIVGGVDPRRIMLLTFSRRAAEEMIRRVQRIASEVLPKQARLMVDDRGHSMRSAADCCANILTRSDLTVTSPFMIAKILLI